MRIFVAKRAVEELNLGRAGSRRGSSFASKIAIVGTSKAY